MNREDALRVEVTERRDYSADHWSFEFDIDKHRELINKIYDQHEVEFKKEQDANIESETAKSIVIKNLQAELNGLKNRTCNNCKHYTYCSKENGKTSRAMPYYKCTNENDIVPDADGGWLEPCKEFGCNQWEGK